MKLLHKRAAVSAMTAALMISLFGGCGNGSARETGSGRAGENAAVKRQRCDRGQRRRRQRRG